MYFLYNSLKNLELNFVTLFVVIKFESSFIDKDRNR